LKQTHASHLGGSHNQPPSRKVLQYVAVLLVAGTTMLAVVACPGKSGSGDEVLAKVNGKRIQRSEVDKYYQSQTAGSTQQPSAEQATALKLSILGVLIEDQIMLQRAEKMGLLATEGEVEDKLREYKAPYTKEEYERGLKSRNLTEDELKRQIRDNLTKEKLLNKEISSKVEISENDINEFFNSHKAEFNIVEPRFHLAQIVVSTRQGEVRNRKNDDATNEADARKKAQEIANRLQSGEDFASVAMNYSEDPATAPSGGDMGFIPESALKTSGEAEPATLQAIMRLNPGQTSGIIPVADPRTRRIEAFRILRLNAKQPAGQRDLSDPRVQQAIRDQLRGRREQLLKAAYYEVLRNEAKVENYLAQQVLKNSGNVPGKAAETAQAK
jgi:peptidyl-prolyl cis-trans isomerase SurA